MVSIFCVKKFEPFPFEVTYKKATSLTDVAFNFIVGFYKL